MRQVLHTMENIAEARQGHADPRHAGVVIGELELTEITHFKIAYKALG